MNGENDIRQSYAEYDQESSRIFFKLFNEFRMEADTVEKDGDENVFQTLRAKYSSLLKQRLERTAGLIIIKYDAAGSQGRLRISFAEKIKYYQKEFTRKSEAL
jgi:hypothetical protein